MRFISFFRDFNKLHKNGVFILYNSNNIAERIKTLSKSKGISIKKLLSDVGLGFNTMANMKTSMPKADNLAKIADYLDVSVDYLLGRTDVPEINGAETKRLLENYTPDLTSDYIAAYDGNAPQASALSAEQKEKVKKLLIEIQNEIL